MSSLIAPFFNLIALLVILGVFLKKPLADFVVSRHNSIRDELEAARQLFARAQKSVEDLNARMQSVDAELSTLQAQAREDGQKISVGIVSAAKSLSSAIVSDAKSSAASAQAEFRTVLRRELASKALERAEARLRDRLTGEDHARIRREF